MAEPHPPTGDAFHDRSTRLVFFGSLSVLAGGACGLLALLYLALLAGAGKFPGTESLPPDPRTYLMGALLYVVLGAAFVSVGVGSIRRRRWVRSLMLTLAWTWLLGGVMVLILLPDMLDAMLFGGEAGFPVDPTMAVSIRVMLLAVGGLLGVALPALFVLVYQDRHLRMTCEAHDPCPAWTERCAPQVLGLAVGLGGCGVVGAVMALQPAVPLFGKLVTGWPGALLTLAGAGACLWMARQIYALRMSGWWATTLFLALLGISTWVSFERLSPSELFTAMGYPDDAPLVSSNAVLSWSTVVVTLLSLVYMARIRKHFARS